MGAFFSRRSKAGTEGFYANFEKHFEKLNQKCNRILDRRVGRRKRARAYSSTCFYAFGASAVVSAAHLAWMHQQPAGTYTLRQHMSRTILSIVLPLLLYFVYGASRQILLMLESRDEKELKRLNEIKKKLLKDLKDSTRFEKTMALIKKYDPDEQQPILPGSPGMRRRGDGTVMAAGVPPGSVPPAGAPGVTPGVRVTPASQLLARTGNAAAAAAAGAGKALFPMFEHLANNMIGGDNPALLEELKRMHEENLSLKSQLKELHQRFDLPLPDHLQRLSSSGSSGLIKALQGAATRQQQEQQQQQQQGMLGLDDGGRDLPQGDQSVGNGVVGTPANGKVAPTKQLSTPASGLAAGGPAVATGVTPGGLDLTPPKQDVEEKKKNTKG